MGWECAYRPTAGVGMEMRMGRDWGERKAETETKKEGNVWE